MRKFFKNKVLYILSATAIIFSCLFMFLFKGPQAKAESIEYDKITAQDIVANNSTKLYSGKYGTWSWTGVSGINTTAQMDMLGVTGYFEISTANDFKLVYTPNAATKSKIASMYVDIYWAGGDECVPGGVNISNIFSADIARTGYWYYTNGDLTSPNTSKSNVIMTIKKPATGKTIIWQSSVGIGYNASAPVTISKGTGVKSVYLATTDNATSGSVSGTEYDSGTTVYGYAELANGYKAKDGWALVSGNANTDGAIYRIGSVSAGSDNFGTVAADEITYTISYNLNGGTHGKTHPTSYKITTDTFIISDPTRTGYTFDGWSWTGFTGKVKSLTIAKGSIGDRSLIANWTADTYTIAFDKNAEDATGTTNSVTATYDSEITLTDNGFSRVGYDFKGWATSSTGSVVYADGATLTATQVNNLYTTAKKGGTYTLYANWAYVEEIQAVVDNINNIDPLEYTDTCNTKIETAEASYAGLSDIYKEVIAEYAAILENAREVYDNVDAAVKAIDAIGTVEYTNTCKTNIDGAKALYAALEADELAILPEAKAKALEDADKAYAAMDAINSIGTVVNTETCKTAITTARTAYDNLTLDQQALVAESFTKTLEDDEAVFEVIDLVNLIDYENTPECEVRIEDARDAYDDLTPDQEAIFPAAELKTLEDAEKAFAVMQAIDEIGVIENTNKSRALVKTARDAYDALENNEQKALVLNIEVLEDAEDSFEKVDNTDKLINDIGTLVYPDSEATISAAKAAYNGLTPFEKGLVLNYETLTHKDKAYETIKKINQIGSVTYPDSGEAIAEARAAYNDLTDLEKDYVGYEYLAILATAEGYYNSLKDNAKADDVIAKIKAIAPVKITDECKENIDIARAAYNALENDEQRELVYNYKDLTKAETDYDAAKPVVDLIKALGDVLPTDECKEKITAAREAYGKLTADQQALVYNYKDLTDREAAKPVVDAIALIDEVDGTTECQEMLTAVRTAYKDLTDDQKTLVLNIDALEDAEAAKKVADLIQVIAPIVATEACQEKIDAARDAYDDLTADQQALVANYDDLLAAEAVKPVVDKIAAIGTIDGSEACQGRITDARKAFDELDEEEQALVSNKDDLLNAEAVEPVVEKINAIGKVTYPTSKTAIETARVAYGELNETQQALVPAEILKALEDAEAEFKESDDEAKANAAIEKINAIGKVAYPTSKSAIDAARTAYKDLTDDQKELIPAETLKVLEDAEALYNAVDAVVGLIDDIGEVAYTEESKGKIDAARKAYEALTDAQKEIFPEDSLDELEAAEKQYQDLLDKAFAQAVIDKINNIGKVKYPTSEAAIKDARDAYDALTPAQKTIVGYDNYSKLVQAEGNLEAQKDLYFADKVKKLIIAIEPLEISDECKARIDAAREEYGKLTEAQQVLVTNYEDLVNAETNYAAAKKVVDLIKQLPDKLVESRTEYNALTEAQKALVYNYNDLLDAEASKVDTLISAIGTVAYTADSKAKIDAARKAYNELVDDAKDTVKNLEVLTNAENEYNTLKTKAINDAKEAISVIGEVVYTEESKAKIDAARKAFDAVLEADQSLVTNKQTLLDAEEKYAALKADHEAAEAVDKLIAAIGEVAYTKESKDKIDAAREAYGKLTEAQQKLVTKLDTLVAAENLYGEVDALATKINAIPSPLVIADATQTAIDTAMEAYEALSDAAEAILPTTLSSKVIDNDAAYEVMKLIKEIEPFEVTDECKERIDKAKKAYGELTEAQQALVANKEDLDNADANYNAVVDQAKADEVEALIDAIGTFAYTEECKGKIDKAKEAYDKLTETQQKLVENSSTLTSAVTRYTALDNAVKAINAIEKVELTDECAGKVSAALDAYLALGTDKDLLPEATKKAYEDKLGAYALMENIAKIGDIAYTKECIDKLDTAKEAYESLSPEGKALVTNYDVVTNAYLVLEHIDAVVVIIEAIPTPLVVDADVKTKITDARAAYGKLTKEEVALFPADTLELLENNEVAYNIMEQINAIPTQFSLSDNDAVAAIEAARKAYDNKEVSDAQRALVANYQKLLDAEVALTDLKIAAIGTVAYTAESKGKIDAAKTAYEALTEAQQELVTKKATLDAAETTYATLKAAAISAAIANIDAIGTVAYTQACYDAIIAAGNAYILVLPEDVKEITNFEAFAAAANKYVELRKAAINDVITKIDAIEEVEYTSECMSLIKAARAAFNALLENDDVDVTNKADLTDAENEYNTLKNAAISDAIAKINAIGEVAYTADCKGKIDTARSAFNGVLTADEANVTNKQTLLDAEAAYKALEADHKAAEAVDALIELIPDPVVYTDECEKAITDARAAYDKLTDAQQELVNYLPELEDAEDEYATLKADHEAAEAVDALIELIPDPVVYTDECEKAITDARAAYDKLTDAQQELVNYLPELEDAEDEYAALKADHEAAEAVDTLIDAIGEVAYTKESKTKIDAALNAYKALTGAQQELVTKKATLDAADAAYNTLKTNYDAAEAVDALIDAIGTVEYTEASKAKIDVAKNVYEALTEAQKALVTKKATLDAAETKYAALKTDYDAAADAEAKINAIGTVAYTEASKAKIDAARAAYNGLTNAQKALVKNTKTLTDAEASYKKLKEDNDKADQVEALINGIGKVEYTKESKAKMDAAKAAYNKLTAEQKKLVENYATLEKDMETYEHVGVAYDKINSIPKVENNESTKKSIEAARAAVDALTAEEKAALPNTDKLVEAETTYNKLVKDQKTFNNIMTYAIIGGAALVLVIVIVFFARKKKEDANA